MQSGAYKITSESSSALISVGMGVTMNKLLLMNMSVVRHTVKHFAL